MIRSKTVWWGLPIMAVLGLGMLVIVQGQDVSQSDQTDQQCLPSGPTKVTIEGRNINLKWFSSLQYQDKWQKGKRIHEQMSPGGQGTGAESLDGTSGLMNLNDQKPRFIRVKDSSAVGSSGAVGSGTSDGATGSSGAIGSGTSDGATGSSGEAGSSSMDGSTGSSGAVGSGTSDGATGSSGAIGSGSTDGATGSAKYLLVKESGEAGTSGAIGSSGMDGATGSSGAIGSGTSEGATGSSGEAGSSSMDGSTGSSGAVGSGTSDGATGSSGAIGSGTSDGATGSSGAVGSGGAGQDQGVVPPKESQQHQNKAKVILTEAGADDATSDGSTGDSTEDSFSGSKKDSGDGSSDENDSGFEDDSGSIDRDGGTDSDLDEGDGSDDIYGRSSDRSGDQVIERISDDQTFQSQDGATQDQQTSAQNQNALKVTRVLDENGKEIQGMSGLVLYYLDTDKSKSLVSGNQGQWVTVKGTLYPKERTLMVDSFQLTPQVARHNMMQVTFEGKNVNLCQHLQKDGVLGCERSQDTVLEVTKVISASKGMSGMREGATGTSAKTEDMTGWVFHYLKNDQSRQLQSSYKGQTVQVSGTAFPQSRLLIVHSVTPIGGSQGGSQSGQSTTVQ